jgi:hypothetical protein
LILDPNRVADDLACLEALAGCRHRNVRRDERAKPITIQTPPLYKALYYRWSALLSLKPNSFGGFGAAIPIATRGYYGG